MMEPGTFDMSLAVLLYAYVGPFIGFAFGVLICDQMKLHSLKKRRHLWLVSVPVALLSVGMLVSSSKVQAVQGDVITFNYAHLGALDQYLMFLAVTIFLGTVAPSSFDKLREDAKNRPQRLPPGPADV